MLVLPSTEYLIYSIAYGSSLALLCMGLTLTYMVTKVPNFAHATLAITGSAVTLLLIDRIYHVFYLEGGASSLGKTPYYTLYLIAPISAFLIVGLVALIQYLLVLRPLSSRGVGVIGLMIATLAFDIILVNILTLTLYLMPTAYFGKLIGPSLKGFDVSVSALGISTSFSRLALPVIAVTLAIALHLFLTRTKFGVSLRAAIENPDLARVLGINVDLAYMTSWFIAGGLAGASGALYIFMVENFKPAVASLVIVSVFAGSILGGLGSIYGALLGGFLVGVTETFVVVLVQNILAAYGLPITLTHYQRLFSLLIVIVMLLLAPQGLTGLISRVGRGGR